MCGGSDDKADSQKAKDSGLNGPGFKTWSFKKNIKYFLLFLIGCFRIYEMYL